jgi:SNF2 family DNA or RNA helicase
VRDFDQIEPSCRADLKGERDLTKSRIRLVALLEKSINCGGCLADDMELGKTVMTLSLQSLKANAKANAAP